MKNDITKTETKNYVKITDKAVKKLFVDGGCVSTNPSKIGGTYGIVGVDSENEIVFISSGFIPATAQQPITNNMSEMLAAINALEAMPEGWNGTLVSDSQVTLGRIFNGWKMKNVPTDYVMRLHIAKSRLGIIIGQHVDGHPSKAQLAAGVGKRGNQVSKWNKLCDELCQKEKLKI